MTCCSMISFEYEIAGSDHNLQEIFCIELSIYLWLVRLQSHVVDEGYNGPARNPAFFAYRL